MIEDPKITSIRLLHICDSVPSINFSLTNVIQIKFMYIYISTISTIMMMYYEIHIIELQNFVSLNYRLYKKDITFITSSKINPQQWRKPNKSINHQGDSFYPRRHLRQTKMHRYNLLRSHSHLRSALSCVNQISLKRNFIQHLCITNAKMCKFKKCFYKYLSCKLHFHT